MKPTMPPRQKHTPGSRLPAADRDILRRLAEKVAQIAALPVQQQKLTMWQNLNGKQPDRPMVIIDQVCWNEMNVDDELSLSCTDAECRGYEDGLRKTIYQWQHFRDDKVIEACIRIPKAVSNSGFGVQAQAETATPNTAGSIVGRSFFNQFETDADLDKIRTPVVTHDTRETDRRLEFAHGLFDGILDVEGTGYDPSYLSAWDPISFWMGVEGALYALIDRPEFMNEMVRRIVGGYMHMLDQLEQQGLLCGPQQTVHCTGAYTNDLPAPGFDPECPRTRDLWMFSMAQMFAAVSPSMHAAFDIEPCLPLFKRFGLVYYGCCEPLDLKLEQVRTIPNLRKISMSPWVNEVRGAAAIGSEYIYSRKPNPALLAWPEFSDQAVREHLQDSVEICARYGCPLELILKDISTVAYEPRRLWRWAEIAMEVVESTT